MTSRLDRSTELPPTTSDRDTLRFGLAVLASVASLTLLFAVQDMMRRGFSTGHGEWLHALTLYGVDWGAWGALAVGIGLAFQVNRPGGRRHFALRMLGWAGLGFTCAIVHSVLTGALLRKLGLLSDVVPAEVLADSGRFLMSWSMVSLGFNLIVFALIVGALYAARYYRDLRTRALREADLEGRLARAELNVLQMQLQPHFLFNALNTISSLVATDRDAARRVLAALGDMLRASIDHTAQQEVRLRDELSFVARYVEIQQARFRERLRIEIDIAPDVLDGLVPSLVLQPLVENAIRHGIERSPAGGSVWIHAERSNDNLVLSVRDDGQGGMAIDGARQDASAGVGLSNIQSRMFQLYGEAQQFRAGKTDGSGFEVRLAMPFRTMPIAAQP